MGQAVRTTNSGEAQGWVAEGYERVGEALTVSLGEGDGGASFCAWSGEHQIVDLWGGKAAEGAEWGQRSRALIFSGTKLLITISTLRLASTGKLAMDRPVADYWPEYATAGKGEVLLEHVLAHTAGQPGIRTPLHRGQLLDSASICATLAAEPLFWPAGSVLAYHPLTFGWILDQVIRCVDGRSAGVLFHEEVASPLGLDVTVGLASGDSAPAALRGELPPSGVRPELAGGWEDVAVNGNPDVLSGSPDWWNETTTLRAGVPAVGGITDARSMAALMAALANGGRLDGVEVLDPQTLALALQPRSGGPDALYGVDQCFGLGFGLQTSARAYGPPPDAYGHDGVGGSVHGVWPSDRVAFSYVTNEMRPDTERSRALLEALHTSVREERDST